MNRLWSTLEVKSLDEDRREFSGIASTPTTDRMGDIVEPKGAKFKLPLVLLWQHDKTQPIGQVTAAKVSKDGIEIRARIEKSAESSVLRARFDEAWESIKLGLVRGLSIGFKPLEHSMMDDGGVRFTSWDWLELSAVTIPANQEASITAIKSIDTANIERAAHGRNGSVNAELDVSSPGATGTNGANPSPRSQLRSKGKPMNIKEQIASFEATRAATVGAMENLVAKAQEDGGRTFDDAEQQEYDDAEASIGKIDKHLEVLHKHEKLLIAKANPVKPEDGKDPDKAAEARGGNTVKAGDGVLRPNKNLPEGMPFVRYTMALAMSKGNIMQAQEIAKQWDTSTPEVGQVLDFAMRRGTTRVMGMIDSINKAAVAAGTTTATTWAAPLVQYNNMAQAFIDYLRPATILGKLQGMQRVPFYTRIPRQTAGSTGYFVGEGAPKPLSSLAFDSVTMEPFKAATIVVITTELARFSNPDAENLVRNDMRKGIAQFLDARFIDPQYTGNAASPASITNGASSSSVTTTSIAGTDAAIETALGTFLSADMEVDSLVWIMSPIVALSLSLKRNTNDEFAYPGLGPRGGTWMQIPVITSNTAVLAGSPSEAIIVLLDTSNVLFSDDGLDIDVSGEASVQMDSAPTGGAVSLVSLWQNNMLGFRAEQFINWKSRRAVGPAYVLRYNLSPSGV